MLNITMYRLMVYYLIFLLLVATAFSLLKILPFNPILLLVSAIFLSVICWVSNTIFARALKVPANVESFLITALILALIITPIRTLSDLPFLFGAAILAMASKYILVIHKKHIFNPAALGIALTSLVGLGQASWWVSNNYMAPFILLGGLLIVYKIRRFDLVLAYLLVVVLSISGYMGLSSLLFLAFAMLTEPQTTPSSRKWRIVYGTIVGVLSSLPVQLGTISLTPEFALLIGNVFSYMVSPKRRLILKLKDKVQLGQNTYGFIFEGKGQLNYLPGQYMEWTLKHRDVDNRGNRRYFTLAASPTEEDLQIGTKIIDQSSSFKKALLSLKKGDEVAASGVEGDFILPGEIDKKLVFIAGGIGITPFRSMVKYLLDTRQKRDIVLFYSNKTAQEIVYKDIFDAAKELGIKSVYTLTDPTQVPSDWKGKIGYVDAGMIKESVPDYKDRIYYLSGPHSMVGVFEGILAKMGVNKSQIKTDYFPGYV